MNWLNLIQPPPKRRLLYLHLPRTGGTSIAAGLTELYFDVLHPHRRAVLNLNAAGSRQTAGIHGLSVAQVRDVVLHYGLSGGDSVRLALGHFRFTTPITQRLGSTWRIATVLREPTSRWLSQYYYNRYKRSDHYRTDLALGAYLESPAADHAGSCYVRNLLSEAPPSTRGPLTQAMIAEAKCNLERIHIVGLLEEMNDFLYRLGRSLGRRLFVGHCNRNPAPTELLNGQLGPAVLKRIAALCEPDMEIYQHANTLLTRRVGSTHQLQLRSASATQKNRAQQRQPSISHSDRDGGGSKY